MMISQAERVSVLSQVSKCVVSKCGSLKRICSVPLLWSEVPRLRGSDRRVDTSCHIASDKYYVVYLRANEIKATSTTYSNELIRSLRVCRIGCTRLAIFSRR